ncbi:MAG: hypothetical protein ACKO9B_13135 [Planctomycetota bacterium]
MCLAAVPDPRFEIFLFGSPALGHCENSSDLDIGISGPEPLPGGDAPGSVGWFPAPPRGEHDGYAGQGRSPPAVAGSSSRATA